MTDRIAQILHAFERIVLNQHLLTIPALGAEKPEVAETPKLHHLEKYPKWITLLFVMGDEITRILIVIIAKHASPAEGNSDALSTFREPFKVFRHNGPSVLALSTGPLEQSNASKMLYIDTDFTQGAPEHAVS